MRARLSFVVALAHPGYVPDFFDELPGGHEEVDVLPHQAVEGIEFVAGLATLAAVVVGKTGHDGTVSIY